MDGLNELLMDKAFQRRCKLVCKLDEYSEISGQEFEEAEKEAYEEYLLSKYPELTGQPVIEAMHKASELSGQPVIEAANEALMKYLDTTAKARINERIKNWWSEWSESKH